MSGSRDRHPLYKVLDHATRYLLLVLAVSLPGVVILLEATNELVTAGIEPAVNLLLEATVDAVEAWLVAHVELIEWYLALVQAGAEYATTGITPDILFAVALVVGYAVISYQFPEHDGLTRTAVAALTVIWIRARNEGRI